MRRLRSSRPSVLLISDPRHRHRLASRPCRSWDRFLARLRAASLDARLAAGQEPESTVLLATRDPALAVGRPVLRLEDGRVSLADPEFA